MPLLLLVVTLLAACGGGAAGSVSPDAGPVQVVEQFMQAVADSNLTRMAQLWGTSRGPSSQTGQPSDYQRRVGIMHAFLKGFEVRSTSQIERQDDRVVLSVALQRSTCGRQVPFTLVRAGRGWLVTGIELSALGTPGVPCPGEERRPPR